MVIGSRVMALMIIGSIAMRSIIIGSIAMDSIVMCSMVMGSIAMGLRLWVQYYLGHQCYFPCISNENAQIFANKLVLIIIRSYSLNNESKILYENDILHDMFISSKQLINILLYIILYGNNKPIINY